ncbi:hypothetical protein [Sorlinia euscelidii]|uniref:hypothetical protein n=1 Tax=Sorlinia euscelidii TaxID=3081148 RepID=UPI00374E1F29
MEQDVSRHPMAVTPTRVTSSHAHMAKFRKGEKVSGDMPVEQTSSNDTQDVSEEALRRALDRLGSRKQSDSPKASFNNHRRAAPEPRRRRFNADRDVIVERCAIPRQNARGHVQSNVEDHAAEIERMKQEIRGAHRKSETATRELTAAKNQIKQLEAHLMHARLRVQELENAVKHKDSRLVALREAYEAPPQAPKSGASKSANVPAKNAKIGKAAKTISPRVPKTSKVAYDPQEPVRWWKD